MNKRRIKQILAVVILVVTTYLFVRYFQSHPQYWRLLGNISPWVIFWVLILNLLMTGVLTVINVVALRLCGKKLKWSEMFMLTGYSSVANFFGPLQSGPGVRAAYLKTKHQVRLRDYTLASLIVLGIYAVWSAIFLLIGTRPWWQTLGALLIVGGGSWVVINYFRGKDKEPKESQFTWHTPTIITLVVLTFIQVCIIAGWYYVELKAVDPSISLGQAISYSGAANFSLFVSVTPDGVGIREAFLLFSQGLHHVSSGAIITANIIDRAVYVVYLLGLFAVLLSMHAKDRLQVAKLRRSESSSDEQ